MSISRSDSSAFTDPLFGLNEERWHEENYFEIVGRSAEMRRLRLQVRRIGPHFRTVLVNGEPGTGKEHVARALHRMSHVSDGPFVVCTGAALEEAVSGHLSLKSWDANAPDAIGCLSKMARRGTLFVDRIHEMTLPSQLRLLHLLRRHESMRNQPEILRRDLRSDLRSDLRMIASTSENLKILASAGRFQQELYERFAMVEVSLPPLRSRRDDISDLTRYFLSQLAPLSQREVPTLSDEALLRLQNYSWPGNLQELKGVLRESLSRVKGDVLESQHLPALEGRTPLISEEASESTRLQDVIEQHVLRVLKGCGGNKVRAAEILGISRSTLYRMLDASASAILQ
jgi:DNA-binding NtrC family response regulator